MILHTLYTSVNDPIIERGVADYLDGKTRTLPLCQGCQGTGSSPTVDEPLDFNDEARYRG